MTNQPQTKHPSDLRSDGPTYLCSVCCLALVGFRIREQGVPGDVSALLFVLPEAATKPAETTRRRRRPSSMMRIGRFLHRSRRCTKKSSGGGGQRMRKPEESGSRCVHCISTVPCQDSSVDMCVSLWTDPEERDNQTVSADDERTVANRGTPRTQCR